MKTPRWIAACALAAAVGTPALADEAGAHPYYLHALSDLKAAAWQVDHRRPEDGEISREEGMVRDEIADAIRELQQAAAQDGKALNWQPPVDAPLARDGRLHAVVGLLRKVHGDVAREEDDPRSRPFQQRGLIHVDRALDAAEHAIGDVQRHAGEHS